MITFTNAEALASELRGAQAAHHRYEEDIRKRSNNSTWTDANWAGWYARHIDATHRQDLHTALRPLMNPMSEPPSECECKTFDWSAHFNDDYFFAPPHVVELDRFTDEGNPNHD